MKKIFVNVFLVFSLIMCFALCYNNIYAEMQQCTDKDFKIGNHGCKNTWVEQDKIGTKEGSCEDGDYEVNRYHCGSVCTEKTEAGSQYTCGDKDVDGDGVTERVIIAYKLTGWISDTDENGNVIERTCTDEDFKTGNHGCTNKYDDGDILDKPFTPGSRDDRVPYKIKNFLKDTWATISVIVQILCVACVVFAGVRYMFASADQRADLKSGLSYLTIGAVLVFGAISIIKLIASFADGVIN